MRLTSAITILLTATALATPAPAANPEPSDVVANAPSYAPEVDARAADFVAARDPNKKKPKKNDHNLTSGNDTDSAAPILTSNVVLELGALGVGMMLWM
ncbi:hypothetical protein DPSP01_000587 [Paraphaeosphaeria sporulosa]